MLLLNTFGLTVALLKISLLTSGGFLSYIAFVPPAGNRPSIDNHIRQDKTDYLEPTLSLHRLILVATGVSTCLYKHIDPMLMRASPSPGGLTMDYGGGHGARLVLHFPILSIKYTTSTPCSCRDPPVMFSQHDPSFRFSITSVSSPEGSSDNGHAERSACSSRLS